MKKNTKKSRWIVSLPALAKARCPCGWTRRAFVGMKPRRASIHMVRITKDSQTHYHKRLTEVYYVLKGKGHIEIGKQRYPLKPHIAVLLPPGVRHRAVGKLTILNFVTPAFDPADEHFD